MSDGGPPAGWYPDPEVMGGQRYWDGTVWSPHRIAPYALYQAVDWKGAKYGRPQDGPGSLAEPHRRLFARLLDGLVIAPAFIAFAVIAIVLIAPHAGPIFPNPPPQSDCRSNSGTSCASDQSGSNQLPGFVWIELGLCGAAALTGVVDLLYQSIATAKFGRTLGKSWMKIRPIRNDGKRIGWGRSFCRELSYRIGSFLSIVAYLDPLWCIWDHNTECLHDKVVSTLVVND